MTQNVEKSGPQLQDFEDGLRVATDQLLLMCRHNGDPDMATSRVVIQLLANASRLSPYIEEVLEAIKDSAYDKLASPLEFAIELGNKNRKEVNNGK